MDGITRVIKTIDDVHVVPLCDLIDHLESERCLCNPIWDEENKNDFKLGLSIVKVFVHNRIKDQLN